VTWRAAAYGWPALVVFVLSAMLAAAATLIARAWQWRRTAGASLRPDEPAAEVATGSTNVATGSIGGDPGHLTGVSKPVPVQARHQ
jgi:hypothetical protein